MLRVAVCWSGLTRDSSDYVRYNKTLFDNAELVPKNDIKFDHFCQFWSKDNKFPRYVLDNHIEKKLANLVTDEIPNECIIEVSKIIDILTPKSLITSSFKDIVLEHKVVKNQFELYIKNLDIDSSDQCKEFLDETIRNNIDFSKFDNFLKFLQVYNSYCLFINKLSQFYAFEKSVLLAKEYSSMNDFDYDVILRMRYDVILLTGESPENPLNGLAESMNRSFIKNCILVENFTEEFSIMNKVGPQIVDYRYIIDNQTSQRIFGITDWLFLGSSSSIYRLVNNLFKNVAADFTYDYDYYIEWGHRAEKFWFNEIKKKFIPCIHGIWYSSKIVRNSKLYLS